MSAQYEAEERFHGPRMHVGTATDREIAAFEAGASWIADPDNEEWVEFAAKAIWYRDDDAHPDFVQNTSWENTSEDNREFFRADARAVLVALRGVVG